MLGSEDSLGIARNKQLLRSDFKGPARSDVRGLVCLSSHARCALPYNDLLDLNSSCTKTIPSTQDHHRFRTRVGYVHALINEYIATCWPQRRVFSPIMSPPSSSRSSFPQPNEYPSQTHPHSPPYPHSHAPSHPQSHPQQFIPQDRYAFAIANSPHGGGQPSMSVGLLSL